MSRIRCNPCEIVVVAPSAAPCCEEEVKHCHKNKVLQCEDPCFPGDGPQFPGGARVPRLIEGWVPDDKFILSNPRELELPQASSISVCSWDERYNLFAYAPSDVSTFTGFDAPRNYVGGNLHLKSSIPRVIKDLIEPTGPSGSQYFPFGSVGGLLPYNTEPFYLLKHSNVLRSAMSDSFKDLRDDIWMKSPTSYRFFYKYRSAFGKSLLFGNVNSHHPSNRLNEFRELSEALYKNKFVPSPVTASADSSTSTLNLEFTREYIRDNRIHMKATESGRRLNNKLLRQYWHFIPSDINLRLRVYRDTSQSPSPSSITGIKVNDDSTIPVHRADSTNVARVHYTEAENLRIWTADDERRYQSGCGCCASGCNVFLCSDRDYAYVLDAEDRAVALGMLGNVYGYPSSGVDSEPYMELTVSSPSIDEVEFQDRSNPLNTDVTDGGADLPIPSYEDFYLLTPKLSGTDTLTAVVDEANPYLKTTDLQYQVEEVRYNAATKQDINEIVRFKSGPGNVLFIDSRDPILYHIAQGTEVSATMTDINFNYHINTNDIYPRRIPAHILIVPTDKNDYNPLNAKSTITRWDDPISNDSVFSRTIRFVPGPTAHTLETRSYIELEDYAEAQLQVPETGLLAYPNGVQGTDPENKKMVFTASDPTDLYNNWVEGAPTTQVGAASLRKQDPIRQVMSFIWQASTYYDTNTNITQNLIGFDITSHPTHPVVGSRSLPIFDVWRSLDQYDFHEFIVKFKDEFWQTLKGQKYFGHQLFNVAFYPEKTYLHKYTGLNVPWAIGSYEGTVDNLRNASGVDFLESNTKMDKALPRRYS